MPKRDLGRLGEATLEKWAAARGITAQKASMDREGWDYILEFPSEWDSDKSKIPRDREPASISCLVQVKATGSGNLNPSVKLSNWDRMIKRQSPVFFLILEFDDSDLPHAAYLVPVDKARISRALRRIRELDSQGKTINRSSLRVVCTVEDRLESPSAESLETAIRDHVGTSLEEYLDRKRKWVESVGYETTRGTLTINLSVDNREGASLVEPLIDLSLGLIERLPINYAEFRDTRFDIPARVPLRLLEGELEVVERLPKRVEVTLSNHTSIVRINMDMFLPHGLAKVVDATTLKARLKTSLFEFVLTQSSISFRFDLPNPDQRVRLGELSDLTRVVYLLDASARQGTEVAIAIQAGEWSLPKLRITPNEHASPGMRELAEVALDAWAVAKILDIQDRVELTARDLISQRERLRFVRQFSEDIGRVRIQGYVPGQGLSNGVRVKVPLGIRVILGNYQGVIVFSLWGNIRLTGQEEENGEIEIELESAEKRFENALAARIDQQPQVNLNAAVRAIVEASSSVPCILLPQYASVGEDQTEE